jgi:dihydrofolate synthase/folylpolyglutamate synthase
MNYQETLAWMFSRLPMYHRIGAAAYKANLDNTIALCNLLGNPQTHFRSIHVAGTNGKGSVAHLLASVLQEHGLKTGLYTSPHLLDFRERIRVNGQMISGSSVTGFIERYRREFEQLQPSFFELTVAMAFDHFLEECIDLAVIEVGLGGRLDSTNIILPVLSVITNISYDHQQFLGHTHEEIAREKAGIMKPGIPVLIGERQPEVESVFRSCAQAAGAHIYFAEDLIVKLPERSCPLKGLYQQKNLLTVEAALALLNQSGLGILPEEIQRGVAGVVANTGLRGRWETLSERPLTICDTGHNEAGIREVVKQLQAAPYKHLHWVFGMASDKDAAPILQLLPGDATYYFCKADIPRGKDAGELRGEAGSFGLSGEAYSSVREALAAAKNRACSEDLIFIGGSTFVVAEVIP